QGERALALERLPRRLGRGQEPGRRGRRGLEEDARQLRSQVRLAAGGMHHRRADRQMSEEQGAQAHAAAGAAQSAQERGLSAAEGGQIEYERVAWIEPKAKSGSGLPGFRCAQSGLQTTSYPSLASNTALSDTRDHAAVRVRNVAYESPMRRA